MTSIRGDLNIVTLEQNLEWYLYDFDFAALVGLRTDLPVDGEFRQAAGSDAGKEPSVNLPSHAADSADTGNRLADAPDTPHAQDSVSLAPPHSPTPQPNIAPIPRATPVPSASFVNAPHDELRHDGSPPVQPLFVGVPFNFTDYPAFSIAVQPAATSTDQSLPIDAGGGDASVSTAMGISASVPASESGGALVSMTASAPASAAFAPIWGTRHYAADEAIVKLADGADREALMTAAGVVSVEQLDSSGIELWHLSTRIEQAYAAVGVASAFTVFQPNYDIDVGTIPSATSCAEGDVGTTATPNDPSFNLTWGMSRISAPAAWNIGTGGNVIVGVIDTGVDWAHPDLAANIWTNPGEIPANGVDDDGNGYIDDVRGWDWVNNDNNPYDDNGHGTHVAGTIGAVGNNGIGVAGVAWSVDIIPLKFLNASGSGSTSNAIKAINYAAQAGAKVLNASWGSYGFSTSLQNAIANADLLFVAAAGNDSSNNDGGLKHYPSSYTLNNIIAVASTTSSDGLSSFSNYGLTSVDLGAPGSSIYSTLPGNSYGYFSGTSMATPHVAGAAALLWSIDPTLSVAEVRDAILASVDPLPSLSGRVATGGRLNVYNAIESSYAGPTSFVNLVGACDFDGDGKADILWRNDSGLVVQWEMDGSDVKTDRNIAAVSMSWHIEGAADFDGDGKGDILWRHNDGTTVIWRMNGSTKLADIDVSNISTSWQVQGIADFDNDGKSDILWRHDNGTTVLWLMNGGAKKADVNLNAIPTSWHIQSVADFNGDGKADILWKHGDGTVVLWQMNGTQVVSDQNVASTGAGWHVQGTGDFNGDGKSDVLWRHDGGSLVLWTMNGAQVASDQAAGITGSSRYVQANDDFTGDGRADILWRHASGQLSLWEMNGAQTTSADSIALVDNTWHVSGHQYDII